MTMSNQSGSIQKPMICGNRKIDIHYLDQKPDQKGIVEILARHITGGDYSGYLRKIIEENKNEEVDNGI